MDLALQSITIIAAFSVAHERVIELARWWIGRLPPTVSAALDRATSGAWAWLPAVALAIATHANLLDAFRLGDDHQPVFFTSYLSGPPTDPRAIIGCCLMGLAVTLGSSFWHDFAKGLIEARGRLQDAQRPPPPPQLARVALRPAPAVPAAPGIVPA